MTGAAAFAGNARPDVLATNQLGRALYAPALDSAEAGANLARFLFLDRAATDLYRDWDGIAHAAVGSLARRGRPQPQ
jgi:hypothetical protein